jgi:hypothetical protein
MANTTYVVELHKVDSKVSGASVLRVTVQAPDSTTAKHMGESMARGYKAHRADRK